MSEICFKIIKVQKENRISWVKEDWEEKLANSTLWKSVFKAICNKNVTAWRKGVKELAADQSDYWLLELSFFIKMFVIVKNKGDRWNHAESESAARWLGFSAWEYCLGFLAGRFDVLLALIGCASPHGSNDAPRFENFHTARSNQKIESKFNSLNPPCWKSDKPGQGPRYGTKSRDRNWCLREYGARKLK